MLFVSALLVSGIFRRRAQRADEHIPRLAEGVLALLLRMTAALPLVAGVVMYVLAPHWMSWAPCRCGISLEGSEWGSVL